MLLGLNAWLSLALAPGLPVGMTRGLATGILLAVPPLALASGTFLAAESWLLFVFPASLLPAMVVAGRLGAWRSVDPLAFALATAALLAYLACACLMTRQSLIPPERRRRLADLDTAARRRLLPTERLSLTIGILSLVFPSVLIYTVHFSPANRAFIRELYPGREDVTLILLDLGVLALWGYIASSHFLGLLALHRRGDPGLERELASLAVQPRGAQVRSRLYVATLLALVAMGLLALLRYG